MKKNCFLAIAGNIGVGKTTMTKLVAEKFGWKAYFEKVIENPYLDDFYKNMERWGFHSQIFFLTQRFKTHIEIQNDPRPCVQDRTIYEDGEVFAANLYARQLMSERDYRCYREMYQAMIEALQFPDLIVYLRASTWTLISRIRKRGRDCEKDIDKEYLMQLNIAYEQWMQKISEHTRVLIVDTDYFDVTRDRDKVQELMDKIFATCSKNMTSVDN